MTYDDFLPRYKRLLKAYGKPFDDDSAERGATYYEALRPFPEGILESAIAKVIADERFFPAASVLREAAAGILAGRIYHAPACQSCHGDGFIEAPDETHFNRLYTGYVRRCPTCGPPEAA